MHASIDLIRHYIPSLFKIFRPGSSQEAKIEAAYENRLSSIQQSIARGSVYEAKETLFDLFWDANEGDGDACLKLEFIERTINSLSNRVPANLKNAIGNICYTMIVDMPEEASKYFMYLSELATLNTFLQDDQTTLLSHHPPSPNGRPLDFQIQRNGEKYLIEILTILIYSSKIVSENGLRRFIEKKLNDKLEYKFPCIEEGRNLPKFLLVPVLWFTDGRGILEYVNVVRSIRESYSFISYFMIYGKYRLAGTSRELYEFVTLEKYAENQS